ncbi:hypothetical protein BDW62DRAFT_196919 [Aspergillus aurantiobrunneus]
MHAVSKLLPMTLMVMAMAGGALAGRGGRIPNPNFQPRHNGGIELTDGFPGGPLDDHDIVLNDGFPGGPQKAARDVIDLHDTDDEYDGACNSDTECAKGSFCVDNWCTAATKLEDGVLRLISRDVVHEDDDYWYLEARAAVDVLEELTGETEQKRAKNKCPKKCGGGKHCCSNHFCQPPNCLGDFDD